MAGYAKSLAIKQTYGAKSENEEGEGGWKGMTIATEKLSKATKSGRPPSEIAGLKNADEDSTEAYSKAHQRARWP